MAVDPTELERRFAELVDAGLPERAESLRALQAESPELARRLALLLDAHETTRDPLSGVHARAVAQMSGFDPDSLIDRELGGWRLLRLIGRGGMGVVYEASRSVDGVTQSAAIKLLSAPLFDQRAVDRFVAEARALARLDHPGICRLRDWGRSPEGWPYLVLDLVRGTTLPTSDSRRSLRQKLITMARIADAVSAAHRQLVAHLDLKPANVLVTEGERPVLLDFGVSRVLNDEDAAGATLTRWLTPRYASPEQLRGEPTNAAADIYALGVMLYEQLTGKPPHDLDGVSVTEALRRIERGAAPPSRNASGVSRDLDAICARAMHADPARRYASADAFADDLRAAMERRPVSARPDSVGYRLSRLVARNPIAVPAGVAAVIAVATLAVLLAFQASDLKRQRDRAEREATRARAVSELLIGSIKAADPSGDKNAAPTLNQLLEATSRRLRLELAEQPDLLAEGLVGIGNAREAMGQHELALAAFDEAIRLMEGAGYAMHEQLDARIGKLDALRWTDRLDEALEQSRALLTQVDDHDRWRVLAALGSLQVRNGHPNEAEKALTAAAESSPADAHEQRVNIFNSLGSSLSQRGQLKEALTWYDRALAEYEGALDGSPDDEAVVRMNRAKINAEVGDADAALADIERALTIRRQLFGEKHYLMVETLGFQSIVLTNLARYDEAMAAARSAIAIENELPGGPTSRQMALQLQALGGAQLRAEQYEAARDTLRQSLDIYALHLPDDHAEVAAVRNNLAAAYNGLGDHRHALQEMLKVWDAYLAKSPDKPTVYLAMIASNVADAYAKLGEGQKGVEWSRRALEQAATTLPSDHWIVGNLHSVLASNLYLTGDLETALTEASLGESLIAAAKTPVQPSIVRENLEHLERIHRKLGNIEKADAYRQRIDSL